MATLRGLGAEVRDVEIPSLASHFLPARSSWPRPTLPRGAHRAHPELYGEVLRGACWPAPSSPAPSTSGPAHRARICEDPAAVLRGVDVIAGPTTAGPAVRACASDREFGFPRSNMPPVQPHGPADARAPLRLLRVGAAALAAALGRPFDEAPRPSGRPRLRAGDDLARPAAPGVAATPVERSPATRFTAGSRGAMGVRVGSRCEGGFGGHIGPPNLTDARGAARLRRAAKSGGFGGAMSTPSTVCPRRRDRPNRLISRDR